MSNRLEVRGNGLWVHGDDGFSVLAIGGRETLTLGVVGGEHDETLKLTKEQVQALVAHLQGWVEQD